MKKVELAMTRNQAKFRLKGIEANLRGLLSFNKERLTPIERSNLEVALLNINKTLLEWDYRSFELGLNPDPTYMIYHKNKKQVIEFTKNKRQVDFYRSDKVLYRVIKLVSKAQYFKVINEIDYLPDMIGHEEWFKEIEKL